MVSLLVPAFAKAEDIRVVEVRRNIPLTDQEPVYKDYYLSGASSGLKPDLVVTAVRKMDLRDSTGTKNLGEINIPVGQLKVIFVDRDLAVAREFKLLPRGTLPMLEQTAIMIGDLVDLKNSFVDRRKTK